MTTALWSVKANYTCKKGGNKMKQYDVEHLRTIAVVGAAGSGKTSFMESVLYVTGTKEKKGSVDEKTSTSDYLTEEKEHLSSISTSLVPVEYLQYKLNFLDTPGNPELVNEVNQALSVVKGAVIVVDGSKGIDVGAEQVLSDMSLLNIPSIIFINKMDKENIKFEPLLQSLRTILGKKAVPFLWPIIEQEDFRGYVDLVNMKTKVLENGKIVEKELSDALLSEIEDMRESIMESVAESSEELLDKYFGGEELSYDEVCGGLRSGVLNGELLPIVVGSAEKNIGVRDLLEMIEQFMPAPNDLKPVSGVHPKTKEKLERLTADDQPFSGYVFKTLIDPFIGQINFVKVFSGTLESGQQVEVTNNHTSVKINALTLLRGKEQLDVEKLHAGDVGVVTKLDDLFTGCTIADPKSPIVLSGAEIPTATIYVALKPKTKRDEDKISTALHKLITEDPSFEYKRNRETSQLLVGGQGMQHINIMLEKLKNTYKVEVDQEDQKIVYRETIKKTTSAEGRHKKQSGGSGQFGVVQIRFEPLNPNEVEFEFAEEIHGGSVPRGYWPAVEKGLIETFTEGPLAGFPVIGIRCVLFDGGYHAVDSNEISFKIAASLAFKNACKTAAPTILEPILKIEIIVKDDYVGDVMGDINRRRGHVLGMEPLPGSKQRIIAEVPESEVVSYTIDLKAMTQGTGVYKRQFDRYEDAPHDLVQKIIKENQKEE